MVKEQKSAEQQYIGVEDTDPVWLKDKGDHFYKRSDFVGAVSAYSKSLEKDKEFLMARLNRISTFIRMRSF